MDKLHTFMALTSLIPAIAFCAAIVYVYFVVFALLDVAL